MPHKSPSDLDLLSKVDLARTMRRLLARDQVRRDLNEIEDQIKKAHDIQVHEGAPTGVDLSSAVTSFLDALTGPQLEQGNDEGHNDPAS